MFAAKGKDAKQTALKLHKQFSHPTAFKLISLIKNADANNPELEKAIIAVTDACQTCAKFKKPKSRPVVSIPMASKFNEVISMDLKVWGRD